MLRWFPLAWMACASPPVVGDSTGGAPIQPPITTAAIVPQTPPSPPAPPRVGMPAGPLLQVSGPEDADFIVTNDRGGGLRLWPTLDGRREPLIVPTLRPVSEIETIRDGDDIAVAAIDAV